MPLSLACARASLQLGDEVAAKQAASEATQLQVDSARKGYRPVSEVIAVLFFAIADLASGAAYGCI